MDRYEATGTPYPDEHSCEQCSGMGCYPIKLEPVMSYADRAAWMKKDAEIRNPHFLFKVLLKHREWWFWKAQFVSLWVGGIRNWGQDDAWRFVTCPDCKGSRRKPGK